MSDLIASLITTLQLLIAALGGGNVLIERVSLPPLPSGEQVGQTSCVTPRRIQAADTWWCPYRDWRVRFQRTADLAFVTDKSRGGGGSEFEQAAALNTIIHELAHAYDGSDDGFLNGSPGHPRPETYDEAVELAGYRDPWEPPAWYCWGAKTDPFGRPLELTEALRHAEWYACEVARTGRLY
ncbi:MAG: hypothetical protein AB7G21_11385 [Dehalococcoidia bacterium]